MWLASFVLRLVGRVGDFGAGSVVAVSVYSSWILGVATGFTVRIALILARAFAKGYRAGRGYKEA